MRTFKLIISFIIFCLIPVAIYSKEISCIPRSEIGETTTGGHIYERDEDLNINNLSRIDFEKLTIVSAEGNESKIIKIDKNLYKSENGKFIYYFITNDENNMVTELTMDSVATYAKILMCK